MLTLQNVAYVSKDMTKFGYVIGKAGSRMQALQSTSMEGQSKQQQLSHFYQGVYKMEVAVVSEQGMSERQCRAGTIGKSSHG